MNNATEITSKLWEMANKLRGTMDASEYKNYILPFMFYRYLSENQAEYLEKNNLEEFYCFQSFQKLDEKVNENGEVVKSNRTFYYKLSEVVRLSDFEKLSDFSEKINELVKEAERVSTDKVLSDNAEELEDYLEDISGNIGYAIEPAYTWEAIVAKIEGHSIKASDYQDMLEAFNKNAKRNSSAADDFANVFSDVNFGDSRLGSSTNERAKALNDIVLMIDDFNFKDDSGHDILGDVYEYLIGKFAANAGKKGGEFYTPHEVSQILARIVTDGVELAGDQFQVYDPAMGSGSLLLTVQSELPESQGNGKVAFFGQELNTTTYNLARMNLMMHGVSYQNMDLRRADTLEADWPYDEKRGIQEPRKFDAVVANPPYSQNWDIKSIDRSKDSRFKRFGVAPASKADFAFVLHGLYHLDKKGTMAIVLPHGVLFRGASEGKIRKNIIDENLLDAIIGLPANLFYGTPIPTCVLVFKGREARETRKDVLFIDASRDFNKEKNQNKLSAEHIDKIIKAYQKREDIEKYAHLASLEEIKENDYNLNIPRYVDTFEEEVVVPLPDLAKELNEVQANIDKTSEELFGMLSELVGNSDESKQELSQFINLLKK